MRRRQFNPAKVRAIVETFDAIARVTRKPEDKAFAADLRRKYMPRVVRAEREAREMRCRPSAGGSFAELVAAISAM
ncbi:hypothetical protein IYY11_17075 [Methylocystis sp. H62]|uniref:hypothetical protein n=1 Tax=Methylocystis sp. H62 TaxID=2785789 RepID=UPI0018C28705|nr:hypothetical protein [Methylocystis sp. H62]MBG0795068.1 hypothetical protein [Methylocystis sp. H62]